MKEKGQVYILISAVFLIGVVGLYITGGFAGPSQGLNTNRPAKISGSLYIEDYRADIYLNGTMKESFLYRVKNSGEYRMLYRNWKVPLSQENLDVSHVELLTVEPPPGTIAYVKDWREEVSVLTGDGSKKSEIQSLAFQNEAGCYKPEKFSAGTYEIDYLFKICPPLEYDEQFCHLNLMLADEHVPYKEATIAVHDPDGFVHKIFSHSPMEVKKDGDVWLLSGTSYRDELLEVEMLLSPDILEIMKGVPKYVPDVEQKTVSANVEDSNNLLSTLNYILGTLILLLPVLLYFIYIRYGREKPYTVPDTLSYVPQKRTPWVVNLIFNGDAFESDENAFYATLLDLHRRKVVEIESIQGKEEPGLRIKLLKSCQGECDEYEKQLLDFVRRQSRDGVFNTVLFQIHVERLRRDAEKGRTSELTKVHKEMKSLMNFEDEVVSRDFLNKSVLCHRGLINSPKMWIRSRSISSLLDAAMPIFIFLIFLGHIFGLLWSPILSKGLILFLQMIPVAIAPSALFGRWKGDYYKEKLEWDAFRNHLTDFVSIQKYAPEDLNMWKEWLVYGTALGVGKKVVEAMEQLDVSIPEVHMTTYLHRGFGDVYGMTIPPSSSGGGFGGGFGSGGGFGGGGGGGR